MVRVALFPFGSSRTFFRDNFAQFFQCHFVDFAVGVQRQFVDLVVEGWNTVFGQFAL